MFIDISNIDREEIDFDHLLQIPALGGDGPDKIEVLESRLKGHAEKSERGADLSCNLSARVQLTCGRCVELFTVTLETEFFLTLVPRREESAAKAPPVDDKDAFLFSTEGGKADLVAMAAEQIYLNLPLKPICKDDCKGLCPECGVNRNWTICGCSGESGDPRLATLLIFKDRRKDP